MSIPFRFKAGASGEHSVMADMNARAHHHRSTTKADHKPFKSRFATKSALKDRAKGKVESKRGERGGRRTPHQQVMSRLARRNQARQLRIHHHDQKETESHLFQGRDGAPKHVAVVPLHATINTRAVIKQLNDSVDISVEVPTTGFAKVYVERFRRNLLYLPTSNNLMNTLDACRLADWVILVLPPDEQLDANEDELLRAIEGQGVTNIVVCVQDVEAKLPVSKRTKTLAQLREDISVYFPSIDKLLALDSKADCANLIRSLCTATTRGIRWRDERSWMLVEDLVWDPIEQGPGSASQVSLIGTIRGKNMNPDRIMHVPGWGDFKVGCITEIPTQKLKRKADEMEETARDWLRSAEGDDLARLAPEEGTISDTTSIAVANEHKGVLLDNHHYFIDDDSHIPQAPKRLPQGTSSYQAAWYLDDVSDSDSDIVDEDDDNGDISMEEVPKVNPEDDFVLNGVDAMTDDGPSEHPGSEIHIDADVEDEAHAFEEFRASRKRDAEDDLEFPDEIELNPEVLARERLAKYRGLKNLRTSEWNTEEDASLEPFEYKRLLKIADYKKSKNAAIRETFAGGATPGTRVTIKLLDVPASLQNSPTPTSAFSLLRHEYKSAVLNLNMNLHPSVVQPVKSKEELVVQIGARRLIINPVFSAAGVTPNDVHKLDRYLHPGRTGIATFVGPLTWGSVPVLVFKRMPSRDLPAPSLVDATNMDQTTDVESDLRLIGTATTLPPSHSRIIAKRAILTGHPYKIHKKLVTVRYMFFNTEDVAWFKALPLWTKRGRQGFIKESLGTHGYFKATFDGKINPMDAIGVSLYKRVWPRSSRPYEASG